METGILQRRYMLGRLANGNESDSGKVIHEVSEGSYRALCGKTPGRRSVGWSYEKYGDSIPTWSRLCTKCASRKGGTD